MMIAGAPLPRLLGLAGAARQPRMMASERAVFGLGCFWAPQEAFLATPGVEAVRVGYASTDPYAVQRLKAGADPPSYFTVCGGDGYTEAVEVLFDPHAVSFEQLLQVFWREHDASVVTPGKEDQYRSVVWPTDDEQRRLAVADVARASDAYSAAGKPPPSTMVAEAAPSFTAAEGYHDRFWAKSRLKFGALLLMLLLRVPGTPELTMVAGVGTQMVFLYWFVECFGLLAAANPFAELF